MKPYPVPSRSALKSALLTLLIVFAAEIAGACAGPHPAKADYESLTRSGFDHYYRLEYDQAISDFKKAWEARPDDPQALNHLLAARLFQQLYRYNALDTRLYTKQRFLSSKHVPIDPEAKKQILDLVHQALEASEKHLKSDPKDIEALYGRGVTEGLYSTYLAVAEHEFWQALKEARAARNDHEEVLRMQPNFADAKTLVGAHEYVVGSLSAPVKVVVGLVGIRGDKNKGLRMLAEAGREGTESGTDAKVSLALFLRREERYDEALEVVRSLVHDRPHNFLFALEEGNLLRDAGRGPDSIVVYRALLKGCKEGRYPGAHTEMAEFALGEALRGQGQLQDALEAYKSAEATSLYDPDLKQRALLGIAEVSDLLTRRDQALVEYQQVIAVDSSTEEADAARKYLVKPYKGN